jgi:hypothetical protein
MEGVRGFGSNLVYMPKDTAGGGNAGGGGGEGLCGKLQELYEDEKRRINEKGIAGTIAEHKT